jgi:hypothetical protein
LKTEPERNALLDLQELSWAHGPERPDQLGKRNGDEILGVEGTVAEEKGYRELDFEARAAEPSGVRDNRNQCPIDV